MSSVLARPGTPSSMQWPRAKIAMISSSITVSWPTMTLASSPRMRSKASCAWATSSLSPTAAGAAAAAGMAAVTGRGGAGGVGRGGRASAMIQAPEEVGVASGGHSKRE